MAGVTLATDDQLEECFELLDSDKKGNISADQMVFCVRALGKVPTNKQCEDIKKQVGGPMGDIKTLKKIYNQGTKDCKNPYDMEKEMRDAFKALDQHNDGTIQEGELRHILRNLGDNLTGDEITDLLSEVRTDQNGAVDYDDFVEMLVNGYAISDTGL